MRKLRLNMVLTVGLSIGAICAARITRAADLTHTTPSSLQRTLTELAHQARPGTLGIEVRDLKSGRTWRVNAEQAFPLMSVFKAPLGATVLSEVDGGALSLSQPVTIRRSELMTEGLSPIAATFRGSEETFTLRQLFQAAVSHSDNTAADVLLKLVGGPSVVTAFLRAHRIRNMRIDRGEDEIAQEFHVRTAQRAEESKESPAQRDARLRRGYEAYLKDPRDRATPGAAVRFLQKLWQGELLSPDSTRLLLNLLYEQTIPDRLRAGLPLGVRIADKCGTSYSVDGMTAAFNDVGILTWPDGHTVIIAAFLMASHESDDRMNAIFQELSRAVATDLHPT
jgi:beta-lactamase class A